jgi:hypothetical protein
MAGRATLWAGSFGGQLDGVDDDKVADGRSLTSQAFGLPRLEAAASVTPVVVILRCARIDDAQLWSVCCVLRRLEIIVRHAYENGEILDGTYQSSMVGRASESETGADGIGKRAVQSLVWVARSHSGQVRSIGKPPADDDVSKSRTKRRREM